MSQAIVNACARVSGSDAVLLLSVVYSSLDTLSKWDEFQTCERPLQWQLIFSYLLVIVFRVSHHVGQNYATNGEDFLLNLRHEKTVPRTLVYFTWAFTLPLFALWTAVGSVWLHAIFQHTPGCLPADTQPWFLIFWQVLSYLWISVHVLFLAIACMQERRIRLAESDVRELEGDSDILARWGHVSYSPGQVGTPWSKSAGLSAAAIKKLPCSMHCGCSTECAICLNDVKEGDSVRTLTGCNHTFHKACIDLWVLRRADCPLCKCEVHAVEPTEHGLSSFV